MLGLLLEVLHRPASEAAPLGGLTWRRDSAISLKFSLAMLFPPPLLL